MNFFKKIFKKKQRVNLTPKEVEKYYDEWTDRYIEGFGDTFQSYRTDSLPALFDYMIESSGIKNNQIIIDAGCGICGPAIYFASQRNVHIHALTLSEYQCKISKENIKKSTDLIGKIEVQQGDFHHLEDYYPNNSVDLIYFLESLTHSTDIAKVLESCKKVLKKGGKVYIKDLYYNNVTDRKTKKEIDKAVENVNKEFCLYVEDISLLKNKIIDSGFKINLNRQLQIPFNPEIGNKFVADNEIVIYNNQKGLYDGMGVPYLAYYESLIEKI